MIEFLLPALLGGIGIAAISGPLGCFIVWRRMSYFGDTLAHSALLGVALGVLIDININIAIAIVSVLLALAIVLLLRQKQLASDTLLGIFAHSTLSVGLVVISFMDQVRVDLTGYLFGDLLAVGLYDLVWIYLTFLVVALILWLSWRPLLMMTVHEELAKVEGIAVERYRLLLMLMISLVIAIAMKLVGVLLITSLLIIPSATARRLSHTPEGMALCASLLGVLSVITGLALSWWKDTPAGPSVVVSAFAIFVLIYAFYRPKRG